MNHEIVDAQYREVANSPNSTRRIKMVIVAIAVSGIAAIASTVLFGIVI